MNLVSSHTSTLADQNPRIIAVEESNKTTSGPTGKRLCERRRSFVRRSKSNYPLVTGAMISEIAAPSAGLTAGARLKRDGACRVTRASRRSVERRELIAYQIALPVVKDEIARNDGGLDARVSCCAPVDLHHRARRLYAILATSILLN
jgi:hypothetical protein